ncbi:MAG: SUMF1/EgtB/PvdO family nonheme iron enzyme [Parachlamydiales bacterium]|nr:SUMF1/EgtB/PvdO family nonheme iron enzyme [Parachlamydiales bacterium]
MTATTRMLGDYTVIKQIGQGALGTVFLAEHRFMKRHYVLKVLPEELASERGFIQRFEDEVKILSTLDHPNIVKIHNVSSSSGTYFLVTDCIVDSVGETTNLVQFMADSKQRLSEDELMRLLRPLADALDYAHNKQVGGHKAAHRGIKLNNVLVGKGKGGPELFLSDFGLSRIVGMGNVLTRTYKVLADALGIVPTVAVSGQPGQERYPSTPNDSSKLSILHASFLQNWYFLAPEQKRLDDPRPIDAKVDSYAFGVLAYYMITGEYPEGAFETISSKAPEYKMQWDVLIQKCLQKDPVNRPALLVEALEQCQHGKAEPAQRLQFEEKLVKSQSQNVAPSMVPTGFAQPTLNVAQNAPANPAPKPAPMMAPMAKMYKPEVALAPAGTQTKAPTALSESDGPSLDKPLQPVVTTSVLSQMVRESTVTHYEPERRQNPLTDPIRTEMIVVPGGRYFRGSPHGSRDEMPRHQVNVSGFAIDIHPVTNEQFVRFIEALGGEKDHHNHDMIRLRESRIRRSSGRLSIESGYAKHPVVGVTWYGSLAYAKWVGRRLPTEAEWEIASLGGLEDAIYPTGEEIEKSQANFFSADTTSVMSYAVNGYGLYDVAGNVYEWCQDWYDYNYYTVSAQEPDNPQGPIQGVYRVLRGGCWKSLKEDLRSSHRHRNNPGTVNRTYGFRCAADLA